MRTNQSLLLTLGVAGLSLLGTAAQAAPFTYNPRDLLLGVRSAGPNDLVVDLGQASLFYGASGPISLGGVDLNGAFGSLDGLSFAVFGDVRTAGDVNYPLNSLWVTEMRTDINVQSTPWNRQSQFSQGNAGSKIDGIANGAVTFSSTIPPGPNNTVTAVLMPDTWNSGGSAYSVGVGASGNFAGSFQGNVENTTPVGFALGGSVLRSDLYELKPGSGPGTYLGYFELSTSGALTFNPVPEPASWTLLAAGFALLIARCRLQTKS